MSLGIFIIRLVIGLIFMGHGFQKLFGWFGGYGIEGTGGFFESIGLKPGKTMAALAGVAEVLGGLLFLLGLFTPLASLILIGTMVVAVWKVHLKNGFWNTQNGYEFNLVLIIVAIGIALTGAGDYSLDAVLFGK
jgi:putative oxidoreductase